MLKSYEKLFDIDRDGQLDVVEEEMMYEFLGDTGDNDSDDSDLEDDLELTDRDLDGFDDL